MLKYKTVFKIKAKKGSASAVKNPAPCRLTVTVHREGPVEIAYNPSKPPHVFFDTNVLLGLSKAGLESLQRLQANRGFRYRYSMLNYTELLSHLGDEPSTKYPNPFRRYQVTFQKLTQLFDSVLPSAESIFMQAVGLKHYLDPVWLVDPLDIAKQVEIIAAARNVEELLKYRIDPAHYKKLREVDGNSFVSMMKPVKTFTTGMGEGHEWGTWLGRFYSFMIFRASSRKTSFGKIAKKEQLRVIKYFDEAGGGMVLNHLKLLVKKAVKDGRKEYANDFYDMLQLLLLSDENRLFVTSDKPFFEYYAGPTRHRVVPWEGFKASADLLVS